MSTPNHYRRFAQQAWSSGTRSWRATWSSQIPRGAARRAFSSQQQQGPKAGARSSSSRFFYSTGFVVAAVGGISIFDQTTTDAKQPKIGTQPEVFVATKADYQQVYNEIARLLEEQDEYDDGSYGPILFRLAWHSSGSYDRHSNTGGSNGALMRFKEGGYPGNRGLHVARQFLEPVKGESFEYPQSQSEDDLCVRRL